MAFTDSGSAPSVTNSSHLTGLSWSPNSSEPLKLPLGRRERDLRGHPWTRRLGYDLLPGYSGLLHLTYMYVCLRSEVTQLLGPQAGLLQTDCRHLTYIHCATWAFERD